MPHETEFYHDALDLVPPDVVELARFLRDLTSESELSHISVYDDALSTKSWSVRENVPATRRIAYDESYDVEITVRELNWFGLARRCPIPGMPTWKWREIISGVRDLWERLDHQRAFETSSEVRDRGERLDQQPAFETSDDERIAEDALSKLLLQRCAEFMQTFMVEPRPIPLKRANIELTPRQWEVVVLVCNQRLDAPEAAATLGIEVSTVRKYLEEAAKALDMSVKELRRRRIAFPADSSHI